MKNFVRMSLTRAETFYGTDKLPHHVDHHHVRLAGSRSGRPSKLCGIPQDAEAGWIFDASVFSLWATLPERRECAGTHRAGGVVFTAGGACADIECDGEAIRADALLLGKNADTARGSDPATHIFLEPVRSQHLTGSEFRRGLSVTDPSPKAIRNWRQAE